MGGFFKLILIVLFVLHVALCVRVCAGGVHVRAWHVCVRACRCGWGCGGGRVLFCGRGCGRGVGCVL